MYNRIYPGGDSVRIPPDYGGSAIRTEPASPNSKPPHPEPCPAPPHGDSPHCDSPHCDPCEPCDPPRCEPCEPPFKPPPCEKNGGYLGNLLSKISANDLIIYGIIIYMTLQDKDNDLLLLVLLLVVLL